MAKPIGTGMAATLYVCQDCKAKGVRTNATRRPRVPNGKIDAAGKPVKVKRAFCEPCWQQHSGEPTADARKLAEAAAYAALGADNGALWLRAERFAYARGLSRNVGEVIADAIRDQFVKMFVADLQPDGTLAFDGKTILPADLFAIAGRSMVRISPDLYFDGQLPQHDPETLGPDPRRNQPRGSQDGITGDFTNAASDSWDPELLAELDLEDQFALMAFAESDEPDGREPTRDDNRAYIAGKTVPARTITSHVLSAATRYLELKTARAVMLSH